MRIWELILIAISLAMDAFAVAMCRGLEMKKFNTRHALIIALLFGVFQMGMTLLGFFVGRQFERYITEIDHWIAFAMLAAIGGKMIFDSFRKEDAPEFSERLNMKKLLFMAVATSIDALAIGVTLAFLNTNIWTASTIIGIIAFELSLLGVFIGNRMGLKLKNKAELIGGIVLVLMGVKILLEHLGVISF